MGFVKDHHVAPYSETRDESGQILQSTGGPPVFRCDECGSLVPDAGQQTHIDWHELLKAKKE